ncbi:MAG: lipase family protein [Alphaproteobacteria bacterium]|nr:lipase family protein [Alphaproteobacteria bacterium]
MKKIFSLAIFALAISSANFANATKETNPVEALETLVQDYNSAKPAYEALMKSGKAGLDDAFKNPNSFVSQIDGDYLDRVMSLNVIAYNISSKFDADIPAMAQNSIKRRQAALAQIKADHKNATTSKGWVYNSSKKLNEEDRKSITKSIKESFGQDYTSKLERAETLMKFEDELEKFEKRIKEETKPSFIDREVQNAYNAAVAKDENLLQWNHAFKGYVVVDSFLRNNREFGGFILFNEQKNDMIVVVPGTKSASDWIKNVQAWGKKGNPVTGAGRGLNIHKGFGNAYEESFDSIQSTLNAFLEKNMNTIKNSKNPFKCHVTGHSLGAAIATILAYDFKTNLLKAKNIEVDLDLITVASPRLFDLKSAERVEKALGHDKILRIFNEWDIVPKIIPEWYNSKHVGVDFPLHDNPWDEAYMGPTVVNHFMARYAHLIGDAFADLKETLAERVRLEKAIDDFGQNYATAYNDFKNYVNDNDAHVKHVNQIKAEASDSDSDSESYDKIRKDKRGSAKAKKIEAAKIAKQDLSKAKNLKAEADRLEQDAMMASIMFEHAKNKDYSKNKQSEEELANFYQELGLDMDDLGEEQPTPDAIEAY